MATIIVTMDEGLLEEIYTDLPGKHSVMVASSTDEKDIAPHYAAAMYMIERGAVRAINTVATTDNPHVLPEFNFGAEELIVSNQDLEMGPRIRQERAVAFADGYLTGHAELVSCLQTLCDRGVAGATEAFLLLEPLLDKQKAAFVEMCEKMNQSGAANESIC